MDRLPTTVVIPTVGRPSLHALLGVLDRLEGPQPRAVVVVDDSGTSRAARQLAERDGPGLTVLESRSGGPAAARNVGWQASEAP
ncbi:MAG TPA: glycosyltransferase family A protein, partial [Nocardioidaceae bacterium]|nr:glycosyltransferase family A protein [Nocardioidaceae bacterium]